MSKTHLYKIELQKNGNKTDFLVYGDSAPKVLSAFMALHLNIKASFQYVKNAEYGNDNAYFCGNGGHLTAFANIVKGE